MDRRQLLKSGALLAGGAVLPLLKHLPAAAAGAEGSLVLLTADGPNSMDIHRAGTNRPAYQIAVNLYDRLVTYGIKTLADGSLSYDHTVIQPELAESWEFAADGSSLTFKLKPNATFWDGTPVTAADVKWSFDRAVSVGGFPTTQMAAGSLEKPEQFVAVDALTFRINLLRPSKLTLPDLGVPVAIIINATEAKKHATEADPWALDYLHKTPLGSGAYKLERWDPGQQTVYARNESWVGGPVPALKRVIVRQVPSAATRRALIERGDAHMAIDVPSKDALELSQGGKVKVVGSPIECCAHTLCMNVTVKPFDDVRVRRAIAAAVPYDEVFKLAAYGRGVPLWGGPASPGEPVWPQPLPFATDLDKARALLAEAGLADGFETTLYINLGLADWQEPAALLIQEGLAKVGIRITVEKVAGANWRSRAQIEKSLPFLLENFGGWLNFPDYYFYWVYFTGHLFNTMKYSSPTMDTLVNVTINMAQDDPGYADNIRAMLATAIEDVPLVPLYQPFLEVVMQPAVTGYAYWFHRQIDLRRVAVA